MWIPSLPREGKIIPKPFLIYYGSILGVNGSTTVQQAVDIYSQFELVILNEPQNADDNEVVEQLVARGVKVFLYIYLGETESLPRLPDSVIMSRIDAYASLGAGIHLDQYGYDFETTRAQQNTAVSYAHSRGVNVIANCWSIPDAFGTIPDFYPARNSHLNQYNPEHIPTQLGPGDYYLLESFGTTYTGYRNAGPSSLDPDGYWGEINRIVRIQYFIKEYGMTPLVLGYPRTTDGTQMGPPIDRQADIDFVYKLASFCNFPWYSVSAPDFGATFNQVQTFSPTSEAKTLDFATYVGPLVVTRNDMGALSRDVGGTIYQYTTGLITAINY